MEAFSHPCAIHTLLAGTIFLCHFRDKIHFHRLKNLQTAKFAGGIVLISQALQTVVAQLTRGNALIWQSMASETG
jgi:hypothetical protein